MEKSVFIDWLDRYFKGIVVRVVEKVNESNEEKLTYMFKSMLRKEFSVTGKWESVNVLSSRVSADFVALNSSLPLKSRDSIGKVSGDIVKSGMELYLDEAQLQALDTMIVTGATDAEIVAKLFEDTPKVITGIYELMERCFLEGFSSGVTMIDDKDNVGLGVRIDYGYLDSNKSGVKVLWSNANDATPLDDLRKMIDKANDAGNPVSDVYMDDVTFEQFASSKQVKDFYAWSLKVASGSVVPAPSLEDLNSALGRDSRYNVTIHVVKRKIKVERDGKKKVVTPWSAGKIILTGSTEVGVLAYAKLAEENHPVDGVSYQKADGYILVSKFRENRPHVAEFTSSQARVVPVICNVEGIYQIDTKVIQG